MHANTQNHGHIENLTNHFGMQITNYPVNQIYEAVMYVNMHSLYMIVGNVSLKSFYIVSCINQLFDVQKVYKYFNVLEYLLNNALARHIS